MRNNAPCPIQELYPRSPLSLAQSPRLELLALSPPHFRRDLKTFQFTGPGDMPIESVVDCEWCYTNVWLHYIIQAWHWHTQTQQWLNFLKPKIQMWRAMKNAGIPEQLMKLVQEIN